VKDLRGSNWLSSWSEGKPYWTPVGWRAVLFTLGETILLVNTEEMEEEWKLERCCFWTACLAKSLARGAGLAVRIRAGSECPLIEPIVTNSFGSRFSFDTLSSLVRRASVCLLVQAFEAGGDVSRRFPYENISELGWGFESGGKNSRVLERLTVARWSGNFIRPG
jgi:hypothetical protein